MPEKSIALQEEPTPDNQHNPLMVIKDYTVRAQDWMNGRGKRWQRRAQRWMYQDASTGETKKEETGNVGPADG